LKKIRLTGILVALLAVCMLTAIFSTAVLAADEDYSNPGAASTVTLTSADILERALGLTLTEAERDYLNVYGGESITYGSKVSANYVTYTYDEDEHILTIVADVYEYTTASGFKMKWIPKYATVGDDRLDMIEAADGSYTVVFRGNFGDGAEQFDVFYSYDATVSAKSLTVLASKAYTDAGLWSQYATYLSDKSDYDAKLALYNKYVVEKNLYDDAYALYMQYLADMEDYDTALLVYKKYESDLEEYNVKYNEYKKYLSDKAAYDASAAKYEKYLSDIETVRHQIGIIDGIKEYKTSLKRSVYDAIVTDTVTQVLENKDVIANELTGVDGSIIDLAGESTENLRVLFSEYFALTDEEAKYNYYSINYEEFRKHFTNLFKTLDYLYGNGKVRLALRRQDKLLKYEILLAQLFYVVNALNDAPVANYMGTAYYNSSYKIGELTPLAVHEWTKYMEDKDNAVPLETGYPAVAYMPDELTPVLEPSKPTAVQRPIPPTTVNDPGNPPEAVTRPTPITKYEPPYALENQNELPCVVSALISEYENGGLSERAPITENKILPMEISATRKYLNVDELLLVYHGTDGTQLDRVNVERGSYVEYVGKAPTKAEDLSASYTFVGWQDGEGNAVDMTRVDCDGYELHVYPLFRTDYKTYPVYWYSDGELIHTSYERYGVIPTCPVTPVREDDGSFMFNFIGWREQLSPVSEKASKNTYNARFEAKYIVPFSNGSGAVITYDGENGACTVDCSNTTDKSFDLSNLIPRVAGKCALTVKTRAYSVTLSYSEAMALLASGATSLSSKTSQKGGSGYSFSVSFLDGSGLQVPNLRFNASFTFNFVDPDNTVVYYENSGVRDEIRATVTQSSVSAAITSGVTYFAVTEYSVGLVGGADIKIILNKTGASPGERVALSYAIPDGVEVHSIYYVTDGGERVEIVGGEFIMPTASVSVGIEYSHIEYTVTFVSDGKIISIRTYRYGEEPTVPPAPQKAQDETYSYRFLGWSAPVLPVTESVTYRALYEPTPLPPKEVPDGLIISDGVMRLIMKVITYCLIAFVFASAVLIAAVKAIVRVRRRAPRQK